MSEKTKKKDDFTWESEPVWERVIRCIRMLAIHGILTSGERDKALARAMKKYHLQRKTR